MSAVKRVLVVGGGIGGLSAAIALRRRDIEVDIVEVKKDWTVYHVGVVVQGNAIRAMAALGIADACIAAGFAYDGLLFQDLHGHVLMDIHGIPLAGPNFPADLGLTRPALHKILSESAVSLGTKVRLGTKCLEISDRGDSVEVLLSDGSRGTYDLVIGADGLHSQVRRLLFGEKFEPKFLGQGCWRYNVPRPPELLRTIVCLGLEGGKCGFIPLTEQTGYVLLVQSEPGNVKMPEDRLAEIFRERLAACTGVMGRLRDQIVDSRLVVYRPLDTLFVSDRWFKGRIVLLGDAVHAIPPHAGQGAAQAMEDAVVLGELLGDEGPVPQLLEAYMKRRYERCKFVYDTSVQLSEWEQRPTPDANPMGLIQQLMPTLAAPV